MNEKLTSVEDANDFLKELKTLPLLQQLKLFYNVANDGESKKYIMISPRLYSYKKKIKKYILHEPSIADLIRNGISDEELETFLNSEEFIEEDDKRDLESKLISLIKVYEERTENVNPVVWDEKECLVYHKVIQELKSLL